MIYKELSFLDTLFPETEESSQVETIHQPALELENKRYEGCKQKIAPWIMKKIEEYTSGSTFCDLFGGTGIITKHALSRYDHIIINDFLYSNKVIYDAFFGTGDWDKQKVLSIIYTFNNISPQAIPDNYYSDNYGGKYFEMSAARIIGYIRDEIERIKPYLTPKEYAILLASLLYSMDRVAITCGHYDSYRHSGKPGPAFELRLVNAQCHPQVEILREDANEAVKHIKCDIMYIDPPYNSRQSPLNHQTICLI